MVPENPAPVDPLQKDERAGDAPSEKRYRWYIVGLCLLTFLTASMDRHVFGLLVDPIKQDLSLSDSELGLLTGAAFVAFYLLCGVPFGRLLDSKPRPKVLGLAMSAWSLGTILTGFTGSFAAIFATRAIVGAGEAAVSPATGSIVADAFHGRSLARPMTMISLGSVLGPGLSLAIGGAILGALHGTELLDVPVLGVLRPWQLVFLVIGLPGLLLAPVMFLTRDPPRQRLMKDAGGGTAKPSFSEVWRFMARYRKLALTMIGGFAALQVVSTGFAAWAPAFVGRSYGVATSQAGVMLGVGYVIAAILAITVNAPWMDRRMAGGDAAGPVVLARGLALGGILPMAALGILSRIEAASVALGIVIFTNTAVMAASVAWARILPNQVRAQVISLHLISTNLIGGMLGPFIIGFANDRLVRDPAKIGITFSVVCVTSLIVAAVLFSFAIGHYRRAAEELDSATTS